MILRNKSVSDLLQYIKQSNRSVVLFGAGVIGTTVVPSLFQEQEIMERILFYVDNDSTKHGETIYWYEKEYTIYGIDSLDNVDIENTILIITNSQYEAIVKQLDKIECLENLECYIMPIVLVSQERKKEKITVVRESDIPLIPKILHYIWLGNNEMPQFLKDCIKTWSEYCPNYEICCWNEKNYNFFKHPYMKQAYEAGKWAYVSDYARLDILCEYGGIYMDTDVYLVQNLDEFLYQKAFSSFEKWNVVNSGGCCGTIPQGEAIKKMLEFRKSYEFIKNNGDYNLIASGFYETKSLIEHGLKLNGSLQKVLDMNIYPYDFFHPYDYMSGKLQKTENTHAIHCFNGGWLEEKMIIQREGTRNTYLNILQRMERG